MSFAVVVTFQIKPGQMARFMPLIETNAAASVRDEPGCHRFDVATDPARPDEVFLYEIYDDAAAFDAHRQTPHYAVFDEAISELVAGKDVRTFARVFP